MASYIALFFSLVSIILMIVILIRFKKLFSTDSIIEKTKSQMNRIVMDINNNANRDIELINEATRRLRALLNDADKKMENFREASQMLRDTIAETEKLKKSNSYIDSSAMYSVKKTPAAQNQRSLFDEDEPPVKSEKSQQSNKSIVKDETIVTATGAAYKEVPLIITKVYDDKKTSDNPISKRSLKEKVEKLFNQGMQISDIAAELSCPISEVQFIIDMME